MESVKRRGFPSYVSSLGFTFWNKMFAEFVILLGEKNHELKSKGTDNYFHIEIGT